MKKDKSKHIVLQWCWYNANQKQKAEQAIQEGTKEAEEKPKQSGINS